MHSPNARKMRFAARKSKNKDPNKIRRLTKNMKIVIFLITFLLSAELIDNLPQLIYLKTNFYVTIHASIKSIGSPELHPI